MDTDAYRCIPMHTDAYRWMDTDGRRQAEVAHAEGAAIALPSTVSHPPRPHPRPMLRFPLLRLLRSPLPLPPPPPPPPPPLHPHLPLAWTPAAWAAPARPPAFASPFVSRALSCQQAEQSAVRSQRRRRLPSPWPALLDTSGTRSLPLSSLREAGVSEDGEEAQRRRRRRRGGLRRRLGSHAPLHSLW